jgi:hypothetical protein
VRQHVDWFGGVADLDLLADAADTEEARDGVLGFGPLRTNADLAGQGEDAVAAAASIPGGTETVWARALFAAVVNIGSSR